AMGSSIKSSHLHVFATAHTAADGISVWIVEDVARGPCIRDEPLVQRQPGAAGLLAYLHDVPRLAIRNESAVVVDGRQATSMDLSVVDRSSGCPDKGISFWLDTSVREGAGIWLPEDGRLRLIVVDVNDATVAFEIWSYADLDRWLPTAQS